MIRRPPRSTRTDTLFPYTTLFRSLWTLTGLYMVTVHIDIIHGDNLVRSPAVEPFDLTGLASPSLVVAAAPGASEVRLQRHFGRPVWRAETPDGPRLFDAKSGQAEIGRAHV